MISPNDYVKVMELLEETSRELEKLCQVVKPIYEEMVNSAMDRATLAGKISRWPDFLSEKEKKLHDFLGEY